MPKRSNDFQQLIKHIYSQMVSESASVQESAFLKERCSTSMREVDILIECELAGHMFRMAIECRDSLRKVDVVWIDGIIGKYRDLDIDKVVAVSRSGFSKIAKEKALANKIETLTLARALTIDWPHKFIKLGVVKSVLNTRLERIHIEAEPPLTEKPQKQNIVTDDIGKAIATLNDIVQDCFNRKVNNSIREYLNEHFAEMFKTLADLRKPFKTEQSLSTSSNIYLIDSKGVSHKIRSVTFFTESSFTVEKAPVEHYTLGEDKALITTAALDSVDLDKTHTINVIQIPGKEKMVVSVKSSNKEKGTNLNP